MVCEGNSFFYCMLDRDEFRFLGHLILKDTSLEVNVNMALELEKFKKNI